MLASLRMSCDVLDQPVARRTSGKAEADVLQIIKDLRKQFNVAKVFLVGGSMGGTGALTFAALHPGELAGVCAINPHANLLEYQGFQDAIVASFGGSKTQIPEEYKKRSAEYWPERFTMPVSIVVGGKDTIVPPESAMRLASILNLLGRKILLIDRLEMDHSATYEDTTAALEFVVSTALGPEAGPAASAK